jgi:tRNA threonylcarbamoyladenosine biosynthesis protein TsaE
MKKFQDCDISKMKEIAYSVASGLKVGDVVCLSGDLGVGKTSLAKMMIQSVLLKDEEVTSPTFNLVHTYDTTRGKIWHFDLYRLNDKEEIIELGIDDAFDNGISIIEWPEIIEDILPETAINIRLSFSGDDFLRDVYIGK